MTQNGDDPYYRMGVALGILVGRALRLFLPVVKVRNWSEGMGRAVRERLEPGEAEAWRIPAVLEITEGGDLTPWGQADQLGPVEQDRLIALRATWEGRALDDH